MTERDSRVGSSPRHSRRSDSAILVRLQREFNQSIVAMPERPDDEYFHGPGFRKQPALSTNSQRSLRAGRNSPIPRTSCSCVSQRSRRQMSRPGRTNKFSVQIDILTSSNSGSAGMVYTTVSDRLVNFIVQEALHAVQHQSRPTCLQLGPTASLPPRCPSQPDSEDLSETLGLLPDGCLSHPGRLRGAALGHPLAV